MDWIKCKLLNIQMYGVLEIDKIVRLCCPVNKTNGHIFVEI